MIHLALFVLSVVVLYLVRALWINRARLRELRSALKEQRPLLIDTSEGFQSRLWRDLVASINNNIELLRETTARRNEELTRFEATLGSLQEAVLIVDEDNYILLANGALRKIFHRDGGSRLRVESVLHSAQFMDLLAAIRKNEGPLQPQELEFTVEEATIWVEATGAIIRPWAEAKGAWVLFVLHDITRQKRLENMRKEFVANVSHELRTPLSVIKGYADTLVEEHMDLSHADRGRFLETIQRHSLRLQAIVEDLLVLSRLESQPRVIQAEPIDVLAFVKRCAEEHFRRPQAARHKLAFDLPDVLPQSVLDTVRLTQVFDNLIDNALKYTATSSTVTIGARVTGDFVELRVSDNGPGIPAEDLPRIFERFYRVDKARSRDSGGTGLGLSIVKHIVQLHGGRTWAESELGKGTTILFTLPISR